MKIIYNYLQRLLPVGYVELEYLESTGTQWIDTGVNANSNLRVKTKIYTPQIANALFGARKAVYSQSFLVLRYSTSPYWFRTDYGSSGYEFNNAGETWHEIDKNKNLTYFDGTLINTATAQTFSTSIPLTIFAMNTDGTVGGHANMRLAYMKIYDNDNLIRNFIPCYRYLDGVEGLYDIVGKQFFTNQGTGRFIRGKEINSGNLLNLSKFVRGYPSNTGFDKATKRTFTQNTYIQGIASNNYYSPTTVSNIDITEQTVTIYGQSGYGIAFVAGLKPNCTYKMYCQRTSAQGVYVMYYANDGTFLSSTNLGFTYSECTFTTISDFAYAIIDFVPTNQTTAVFSNIALHESVN